MNALDGLLQRNDLWRGSRLATGVATVSTGFAALDEQLPGGGWPRGALTEILATRAGIGALRLLMPALASLSCQERWLGWVAPPYIPYAPALAAAGVQLSRILLVHPAARQDGLWALEQSLRSGTCSAVLAWPLIDEAAALRRLQLAAEAGDCAGFLFRPAAVAGHASPAALRLQLDGDAHGRLSIHILKRRGRPAAAPLLLDPDHARTLALHTPAAAAPGGIQPRHH